MIETQLEQDIKTALLAGDKSRVLTLRTLKSVILSAKVAAGTRNSVLPDAAVIALFSKEAKKRQESAVLYIQGGNNDRADAEMGEKAIIETYLPAQLTEAAIVVIIDEAIAALGAGATLGAVIGQVKAVTNGSANGALIAVLVKQKLA